MKHSILKLSGVALALLLIYPIITIFDKSQKVWGIPLLYVYVFGVWIVIIIILAVVLNIKRTK